MDRETIGQKMLQHLSIQGEIEGVKKEKAEVSGTIDANESEIKRLNNLEKETVILRTKEIELSKKEAELEKELAKVTNELEAVNAVVPNLIQEEAPQHINFG